MSLYFSEQQLQETAENRYLGQLRDLLVAGSTHPAATRTELDSPEGTATLQAQVANARRYGMRSELDLARYVITAWLLGLDFDTRFPAMAEVLAIERLGPSQKAEALERISTTLLETLNPGALR